MKWVTYRSDHGERTGVLSGDAIYAMPPDVSLLDLVGRGADGLRTAGERVVWVSHMTVELGEPACSGDGGYRHPQRDRDNRRSHPHHVPAFHVAHYIPYRGRV